VLQTLRKIGPVLALFTVEHPEWGVKQAADALGLPRSSTHALLASLAEIGLLQRRDNGRYRLGWRIVELDGTLRTTNELCLVASPVLERTARNHGETVHLAVLDMLSALYVDKVIGGHQLTVVGARVGARLDPHCSAVGKVLLAYADPEVQSRILGSPLRQFTPETTADPRALLEQLDLVRATGVAVDHGGAIANVDCIAAPVRDASGSVVAAVSLAVPRRRFDRFRHAHHEAVVRAAAEISEGLVARQGPV